MIQLLLSIASALACTMILWRAEPRHTYRLAYAPRLEQPSGQNN